MKNMFTDLPTDIIQEILNRLHGYDIVSFVLTHKSYIHMKPKHENRSLTWFRNALLTHYCPYWGAEARKLGYIPGGWYYNDPFIGANERVYKCLNTTMEEWCVSLANEEPSNLYVECVKGNHPDITPTKYTIMFAAMSDNIDLVRKLHKKYPQNGEDIFIGACIRGNVELAREVRGYMGLLGIRYASMYGLVELLPEVNRENKAEIIIPAMENAQIKVLELCLRNRMIRWHDFYEGAWFHESVIDFALDHELVSADYIAFCAEEEGDHYTVEDINTKYSLCHSSHIQS